jgi:enoyl-CoA hydratase/3-hydroxyacyl-CoA dehydrogenase
MHGRREREGMVSKIAVIGAGEMGHGIAELAALNGFRVTMVDIKKEFVDRGMERIRWSLRKLVESHQITEEQRNEVLQRIHGTLELREAVHDADVVIEAILEDLELKKKVFAQVDAMAPAHAILASNTSGLSITAMGRATKRPTKVVGMHFFNPVILMPLIEIVKGEDTGDETVRAIEDLSKTLKKTSVVCRKDVPGFITSRTIAPYMIEAAWIHHEEGIPKETIDSAMRFKIGFPMGPFELADQVGVDFMVYATEKAGISVPPEMKDLVKAGKFGKKTGEGFYSYKEGGKPKITPDIGEGFDPMRILAPVVNVAAGLVEEDVASPAEIDEAMRLGTAFPKGPLALADELGLDNVVAALKGSKRHKTARILESMVARNELGTKTGKGFYEHAKEEAALTYETILVTKDPGTHVATMTLNRPDRLNTINAEMVEDIDRALGELERDREVRCLVITGAGEKAFCAGADVTAFGSVSKAHMAWGYSRRTGEVFNRLANFPKPTLAAINGYALGGGCEMALACDFRLAARRAKIGQTELGLGLITGAGGIPRLVKLLGLAKAKALVLTGGRFTAEEAHDLGLVTRDLENDEFPNAVKEFAAKLAKSSPIAYKLAKYVLNRAADIPTDSALELEAMAFGLVTSTEDVFEGLQAFMEKREPQFTGR